MPSCSLGVIGSDGSATITLVLRVNSGSSVSDTATATNSTTHVNPANNSSTAADSLSATIPALSNWGLALLAALLATYATILLRRPRLRGEG